MLHKTVRITSVLLVVFALTLTVVAPGTVQAYDQDVGHGDIAREAVKLVDNSELKNNSGAIIAGATSEDDVDHIYDLGATNRTCTHFWDVDGTHGHGPGGPYDQNKCLWPNGAYDCYANAFVKGITLYNMAVQNYKAGEPYQAYEYLGHVAHLLADASVPGHAHEDYWPNHDDYESWIADHYFDVSGGRWTSAHASAAGGPVAIPSYSELQARINLLHMFEPTRIPDDMLSWDETRLSLYYLFYTSNQFGDYFNSPDVPGDSFEPYSWDKCDDVRYGCFPSSRWPGEQVMGNYIFVYDIRVTAALYKLFLRSVGRLGGVSPTTTASLSGADGTDGWYTSDVVVTLNAGDESGGGGVKEITYFAGGAQTIPPTTVSGNTASFPITAEGTTMVTYFAVGDDGPTEEQNLLTVQIDKTPPAITVTTPQNNAVLRSGTALDFGAADGLTGIASVSATLYDGATTRDILTGHQPGPGAYGLVVTATDLAGNVAIERRDFAVYDPSGGFVTGGGWIVSPPGAVAVDPSLTGKASFALAARYHKGAAAPSDQYVFQLKEADLKFHSSSYEWLAVSGAKAQLKGEGTINGGGSYAFLLTAIDGQLSGTGGADALRIKIWDVASGATVYDNQMGADEKGPAATALSGGSVVIHP
jgi:hypothetical protein